MEMLQGNDSFRNDGTGPNNSGSIQQEGNVDYLCKEVNSMLNSRWKRVTGRRDYTKQFNSVNSCNGGKDSTNVRNLLQSSLSRQ